MAPAVHKSCSTTGSSPTTDSPIMVTPSDFSGPGDYPFDGQSWRHQPANGSAHGHTNGVNGTHPHPQPPPPPQKTMPIAIVGMACRLPGNVSSPAEFWELCSRARTGFGPIPKDRFSHDAYYHPNAGKMGSYHAQGGNFLTHVDLKSMDAPFFGLTEKEAVSMDPQQRLLLECTFEALENGGIPKHSIVGQDVGVFVGGSLAEYEHQMARDIDSMPMHQATGCAHAMQSNRISHFFDLRGPSFTADTACSASLVALHLACQSMRAGESTHAIVGSCHLNMLPEFWASFSSSRLLSDSGRSIAFDSRGTGFGRGEGCGVIVLKPLDQALRDNDVVRAVIHGSGINQDGKTPGITMPNGLAQERLINKVYRDAGISPADCGFVECHGTGTKVGDPIEATAIHNAIGQGRTARDPLYIGSIKSNIGHLEAASGIAAVIKAALMLERGFLLPNHDFKEPNEKIPWKDWNLKILKRQQPWPKAKKYISVNNFGFGGTNAHVVLGKAPSIQKPQPQPSKPSQPAPQQQSTSILRLFTSKNAEKAPEKEVSQRNTKLFVMTANDKASILSVMKKMVVYLEQRPEIFQKDLMENFAYTLGQRRSLLQWRAAIATDSSFDLIESINSDKVIPCKQSAEKPRLGFIFTGQGAQWHAMGRELYHQYPIYAAAIDRSDDCLRQLGADWSLRQELMERDAKSTKVGEAHISQPSCTAVQLALIDLLRSWDIEPVAVVGHSSGEIGAAYSAGLLSFESAMAVAYHRGRLVPVLKKRHSGLNGAMMAVGGTPAEIQPLIDDLAKSADVDGKVSVACYNSPTSLTISGDSTALTALEDQLKSKHPDMFCRRLQVDTAYHCHHMNMIAQEYRESIARKMQQGSQTQSNEPPQFFSSLHGHRVDGLECAHSEYWVRNLTNPVRFSDALDQMVKEAELDMLVELGPHSALAGPIKQILKATATSTNGDNSTSSSRDFTKLPYGSALARGKNALQTTLDLAGSLFMRGATLNMEAINFPSHNHHSANGKLPSLLTDLPTYPFNHQHKFWHEPRLAHSHRFRGASARNDLIGLEAIYSNDLEPTWRNIVRLDDLPWLRHHEVQSVTIFPISGYAAMALEALAKWSQKRDVRDQITEYELKDVEVLKPLVFSGGDSDVEMTISLRPTDPRDPDAWVEFQICSWVQDAGWTKHCVGLAAAQLGTSNPSEACTSLSGSSLRREVTADLKKGDTSASALNGEEMYAKLSDLGVSYGPTFQGIKESNASAQYSAADVAVIDVAHTMPSEHVSCEIIQPNLLEAIIQMYWPVALANGAGQGPDATVYLPSSIGGLKISNDLLAITRESGATLQAYCKAAFPAMSRGEQPRPSKASIIAAVSSAQAKAELSMCQYLIQVDDLKVSPVASGDAGDDSTVAALPRELCYKIEWEPVVTQASSASSLAKLEPEIVIIYGASSYQKSLAKTLAEALSQAASCHAVTGALGEVECEGKVVVVLDEIDQPFLTKPTEVQFQQLKNSIIGTGDKKPPHGVLWVTNGATEPDSGMVTGLSRTIRSETLLPFATLDLESAEETQAVESVLSVLGLVFGTAADAPSSSQDSRELEFISRNGKVLTPRIDNDDSMNSYVQRKLDPSIPELQPFGKDARCLKLNYDGLSKHSAGSLHFVDDDSINEPLLPDEIEFEVKAIGTNSSDIQGDVNPKYHHLGIEASGVVTRVGDKSTSFMAGQRIAALVLPVPGHQHGGMFRTRARSSSATAVPIPSTLSLQDAAAMPLAYCTAYQAVIAQARVQEGQSILIQYGDASDAVSVGHAVLCLVQMLLGSSDQIYMAVDSEEQKLLVTREFEMPEDHVFLSSRRGKLCSDLNECRGQGNLKGVDAVISVGRSTGASGDNVHVAQDLWSCVAPFGCMVDVHVGKTIEGTNAFSPVGNNASRSNISYSSLDMFGLAAERPDVLKNVISKVGGLIGNEKLRSLPMVKSQSLSEVEDMFKQLQSGQQLAKVVVTVEADCNILATQRTNPLKSMLRPDATYVLIGGAGGLGRSMARWMVSKGARNIVLVSRSANASGKVKELMNDLRATAGANVLLRRCDVADKSSVDALFRSGMSDLPPVRGIVHGSMVLKDVLFEKMTYADYVSVIESKVQGAWNLHHATSGAQLDFFVAISSTAGVVGNRGQAAYAAANTFLDSFVQYRRSQGLAAVSLDLTAVVDAGYLAESGDGESDGADRAAEVARNLGAESTMYEAEVLALLSAAVEGYTSACNHQVVTGVRIPPDRTRQPFWTTDAKFKHLREEAEAQIKKKEEEEGSSAANGAASLSFNAMLKAAQNVAEAEDVICRGLVHKIAALLMLEESDLDVTRTLSHYPLDSLVAIEIRNFLTREFEANLQVLELLSSGSIQFLSKAVCSKSKLCQGLA